MSITDSGLYMEHNVFFQIFSLFHSPLHYTSFLFLNFRFSTVTFCLARQVTCTLRPLAEEVINRADSCHLWRARPRYFCFSVLRRRNRPSYLGISMLLHINLRTEHALDSSFVAAFQLPDLHLICKLLSFHSCDGNWLELLSCPCMIFCS